MFRTYSTPTIRSAPASVHEEPEDEFLLHLNKRPRMTEMEELCCYLALPRVTTGVDALEWWKTNAPMFPHLSEMARDCLAIPATGAPIREYFPSALTWCLPSAHLSTRTEPVCAWTPG